MSQEKPQHYSIFKQDFDDNVWFGNGKYVDVTISHKKSEKTPFGQFYSFVKYSGFSKDYPDESNMDISFSIPEDCWIRIKLSKYNWRWSKIFFGITTKDSMNKYYRKYYFDGEMVTFKADKKWGGTAEHEFIINLEIEQENNSCLPISLDPVIINPRSVEKYFDKIRFDDNLVLNKRTKFFEVE